MRVALGDFNEDAWLDIAAPYRNGGETPFVAIRIQTATCEVDLNGDGQSNLTDFSIFVGCMSEPELPVAPGCEPADLDGDGDADMDDFVMFQAAFGCP